MFEEENKALVGKVSFRLRLNRTIFLLIFPLLCVLGSALFFSDNVPRVCEKILLYVCCGSVGLFIGLILEALIRWCFIESELDEPSRLFAKKTFLTDMVNIARDNFEIQMSDDDFIKSCKLEYHSNWYQAFLWAGFRITFTRRIVVKKDGFIYTLNDVKYDNYPERPSFLFSFDVQVPKLGICKNLEYEVMC
jgi:hypothetical protein